MILHGRKYINGLIPRINFRCYPQAKFVSLVDDTTNQAESSEVVSTKTEDQFGEKLHVIINDLIQIYYNVSQNSEFAYLYINQLCNILNLFSEKRYFQRLTDILISSLSNENSNDSQLINNVIRKWLSDSRVSVDAVLNVVFHLLVYLKDEEKVTILNSISEVSKSNLILYGSPSHNYISHS